jgi:hypothetical protein
MQQMSKNSNIRPAPWMQDTLREGFALLAAGRLDEASACCKRLLGACSGQSPIWLRHIFS